MRRFILACLISWPLLLIADDGPADVPEPPVLPKAIQSGQVMPPDPAVLSEDAAEMPPPSANPEPPDLPPSVKSGETLEPDITIIRGEEETIQEYRVNGEVYMVKVIPDQGPAYYLIDVNGDGKLDVRRSDLDKGLNINMWKLLEWK